MMKMAYRPYMPPGQVQSMVKWKAIKANTISAAKSLIEEDLRVYDTDNSGSDTEYVAFKTDEGYRYYKVSHEWYWADWFSEDRHVANEFTWDEVDKAEAAIPDDRDYLDIGMYSYPSNTNWPPKKSEM